MSGKMAGKDTETDLNFRHPTRGRTLVDRRKVGFAQLWDRSLGIDGVLTVSEGIYQDVPLHRNPPIVRVDDHVWGSRYQRDLESSC
jgi:hypothetical protein